MKIFKELLIELNACQDAIDWAGDKTIEQFVVDCPNGEWLLQLAFYCKMEIKPFTLAKVRCAQTLAHLMKDERSLNYLRISEKFALTDEVSLEELNEAKNGAMIAHYQARNKPYDNDADYVVELIEESARLAEAAAVADALATAAIRDFWDTSKPAADYAKINAAQAAQSVCNGVIAARFADGVARAAAADARYVAHIAATNLKYHAAFSSVAKSAAYEDAVAYSATVATANAYAAAYSARYGNDNFRYEEQIAAMALKSAAAAVADDEARSASFRANYPETYVKKVHEARDAAWYAAKKTAVAADSVVSYTAAAEIAAANCYARAAAKADSFAHPAWFFTNNAADVALAVNNLYVAAYAAAAHVAYGSFYMLAASSDHAIDAAYFFDVAYCAQSADKAADKADAVVVEKTKSRKQTADICRETIGKLLIELLTLKLK